MKRYQGSIITMKNGKRRNKFRVRITIGYKDNGSAIYQNLGCYATKKEAESVLSNYIIDPSKFMVSDLTFKDIYNKWFSTEGKNLSEDRQHIYKRYFEKCESLFKIPFVEIRNLHMHSVIDSYMYPSRRDSEVFFGKLFRFAMKNNIIMKDYSKYLDIGHSEGRQVKRRVFTRNEINKLFANVDKYEIADLVLILIYTGFRITELLSLTRENVDFEEGFITGGIKTKAGKNRMIPISDIILPLVEKRYYKSPYKNIFSIENFRNKNNTYGKFASRFRKLMEELEIGPHTIHDTRHTFATILSDADVNPKSICELIGHEDYLKTTGKIYTHKSKEQLKKDIAKITLNLLIF